MTDRGSGLHFEPALVVESEFTPARLEIARAFKGWTLNKLSLEVAASVAALGYFENGRRQPSRDLLSAIAQALGMAASFFYRALPDAWQENECSFRRRVATPEGIKRRARAHGSLIGLVVRELIAGRLKYPKYNVPDLRSLPPEAAADRCRVYWGLGQGPIHDVGRVAEHHGVVLIKHLRHADQIDAFARRGEFSMIILNTARTSTSRWIFDVAHELGHFALHGDLKTGSKETETQANSFASAFLLPPSTFGREFKAKPFSWPHVFELKKRWRTSAAAIIRRAFDLTALDPVSYRRCYQYMSVQGWLKTEPFEPAFTGPEWLPSAFSVADRQFGLTPQLLCERLGFQRETFTDVTGIALKKAEPTPFKIRMASR